MSAVDVLAKQKLRKRRANTFSTCTRNIQLPTTKRTLTDIFPLTSKILFAVKIVPMNTVAELIKNVQDSSTKQTDAKLKRSATGLIRSERAKLLKVEGDSVELTSDIVPLKTVKRLAVKFFLKPAVQQHIAGVESSTTQVCARPRTWRPSAFSLYRGGERILTLPNGIAAAKSVKTCSYVKELNDSQVVKGARTSR